MDGMLSQDEINALLNGVNSGDEDTGGQAVTGTIDESLLTDTEKDAIGEVANISMGTSATTLYSLVNRKVNITTPVVSLAQWQSMLEEYERPCVFIQIQYTTGLDGTNILVLKEQDVQVITDLMMGGDGTNVTGELGELHLSAISEAMNQMMGSAATSLSTMLETTIDISPPESTLINLAEFKKAGDIAEFLEGTFVKIAFRMQIGEDLVDSTIMQLYPIEFAKSLYERFIETHSSEPVFEPEPEPYIPPQAAAPQTTVANNMNNDMAMQQQMMQMQPQMQPQMMQMQPQMQPQMMQMQPQIQPQMMQMQPQMQPQMLPNMNIQPAQFQAFAPGGGVIGNSENIGLIMDVPLEVTVELGRTTKSISEILDFSPGTIIELEKVAGEPIDVLVNGKFVAKGEVVVIEENFGIRVTEIIN